jgi:hypothetical protein
MRNLPKILLPAVSALIVWMVITALGRPSAVPEQQLHQSANLTVKNKTQAFSILSAIKDGEYLQLTFRNDYPKTINAFTISGGAHSGVQIDLTHNDNRIVPGGIYQYKVRAASLEPSGSTEKALNLTVLDVVFEDGTGDGDADAVADIQNRRLGEKIALTQIVPLMMQTLGSRDLSSDDIDRLIERISLICTNLEKAQSGEVLGGILHGKGYVLAEMEQMKQTRVQGRNVYFQKELSRIHQHYEEQLQRLQTILP